MKEKRVWKFFSIAEQEKEQAFLRQMHRAGWKLVRVGGRSAISCRRTKRSGSCSARSTITRSA